MIDCGILARLIVRVRSAGCQVPVDRRLRIGEWRPHEKTV